MARCLCEFPTEKHAYTRNEGGSNANGPFINFCPKFFDLLGLDSVQLIMRGTNEPGVRFNLALWQNQGTASIYRHKHRLTSIEKLRSFYTKCSILTKSWGHHQMITFKTCGFFLKGRRGGNPCTAHFIPKYCHVQGTTLAAGSYGMQKILCSLPCQLTTRRM